MLAALPSKEYGRLSAHLERVELAFGKVLYERDASIGQVYFVNDGIGPDSMVGMQLVLGSAISPVQAIVQGEGSAMRMSAAPLLAELKRSPILRRLLEQSLYISMSTAMQIAVCNKAHHLPARLARWLMMVRDRLGRDEFSLTQEFLAQMLGVRRAGVTEAAGALQVRKVIDYVRGRIKILNVAGLRGAACSCYGVIRKLEKGES